MSTGIRCVFASIFREPVSGRHESGSTRQSFRGPTSGSTILKTGFGLTTGKVKGDTPVTNQNLLETGRCAGRWPGPKGWSLSFVEHFSVFITLARLEPLGTTQLVSARLWLIAGAAVRCAPANWQ